MNNRFKTTVFAIICGVILAGCGGGSGSSGLKKNKYLGSLPALHADFELIQKDEKDGEKKLEKLMAKGNVGKLMKEAMKQEKEFNERKKKLYADRSAETKRLAGTEIPFTTSKAFDELNIKVIAPIKLDETGYMVASILTSDNRINHNSTYFNALAKDGSIIGAGSFSYWGGESLKGYLSMDNPKEWVKFAGIEFISREEYQQQLNK